MSLPPAKNRKSRDGAISTRPSKSKIFEPFRKLGKVTSCVPPALHMQAGLPYITTVLSHSFQTFDVESLNVVIASPELKNPIKAIECVDSMVVALSNEEIHVFDRGRIISTRTAREVRNATGFKVFGEFLVILTGDSIEIFSFPDCHLLGSIVFNDATRATCMIHPISYVNKLLIGFDDGHLELWNIRSRKLVYSFSPQGASVCCFSDSTLCDIIALGLDDGSVKIMDIKQDQCVMNLSHPSSVTSVSFGSGPMTENLLAVALANGKAVLWNLESRQMVATWEAHRIGSITFLKFVPNSLVILSTAGDNAIAEWVIEGSNVRLLRSRRGHSKPISILRFVGPEGEFIVSSGKDQSLRLTSMIKDSQSTEMSQGPMENFGKKANLTWDEIALQPIVAIDFTRTREVKWDNMLTAHYGSPTARTWRYDLKRLGTHELKSTRNSCVLSVCISSCGNYGLMGCEDGSVDVFNMQSGLHRKHHVGHVSPLIGLGLDSSNQSFVCVHQDGTLSMVDFQTGQVCFMLSLEAKVAKTRFDLEGGLMAVALEGPTINVFDCHSKVIVRSFAFDSGQVTDLAFSEDGKWLISSGSDNYVRVWDMLSGIQIDSFLAENTPLSIALSPSLEFLAVALKDDVAVHVWSNRSLYHPISLKLAKARESLNIPASPMDKDDSLLRLLSSGTRLKSLSLLNVEDIKSRNTPLLPSKEEKPAPFFLEALKTSSTEKRDANGNLTSPGQTAPETEQGVLYGKIVEDPEAALDWLFSMSITTIDLEIRCFSISAQHYDDRFRNLLSALLKRIEKVKDYDLAVAVLQMLIRSFSESIISRPTDNLELLLKARDTLGSSWQHGENCLQKALCLASFSRL